MLAFLVRELGPLAEGIMEWDFDEIQEWLDAIARLPKRKLIIR